MQYSVGRKSLKRFIILFLIIFLQGDILSAADIFSNNLEGMFLQEKWIESNNEVIIYFLNFHKLDREIADYLSLSVYFSNQFDAETGWVYCQDKKVMEVRGLFNRDNSFTMSNVQSLLDSEQNYTTWLAGSLNKKIELGRDENYFGSDKIKQAEHDLQFKMTLIPEKIAYESQKILTEIEFTHNSSSGENRIKAKTWLEGNSLKNIAIAARKNETNKGKAIDYYILQMAAVVVSVEDFAIISNGLLPIGDLSGVNKLFENIDGYKRRDDIQTLILKLADKETGLELSGKTEKYYYILGLNKLYRNNKITYYISGGLYLHNIEDIALSFIIDNEENYRLGFSDQVKWTENLTAGISFYPFNMDSNSDNLACLKVAFQGETCGAMYRAVFKEKKERHEISLAYILDQKGSVSLSCGLDYNEETFVSLVYGYSL